MKRKAMPTFTHIPSNYPFLLKKAVITNAETLYKDAAKPEFRAFADGLQMMKDGAGEITGRFKLAWCVNANGTLAVMDGIDRLNRTPVVLDRRDLIQRCIHSSIAYPLTSTQVPV